MMGDRRLEACFHEAGHAFIRWYFGHSIDSAEVITRSQFQAGEWPRNRHSKPVNGAEGLLSGYPIRLLVQTQQRAELYPFLAIGAEVALMDMYDGLVAEVSYSGLTYASAAASATLDHCNIERAVATFWTDPKQGEAARSSALERAEAIIRSDTGWRAVTAIAHAIRAQGRIGDGEISTLCAEHFGGRLPSQADWAEHWPPTLKMLKAGRLPPESAPSAEQAERSSGRVSSCLIAEGQPRSRDNPAQHRLGC